MALDILNSLRKLNPSLPQYIVGNAIGLTRPKSINLFIFAKSLEIARKIYGSMSEVAFLLSYRDKYFWERWGKLEK